MMIKTHGRVTVTGQKDCDCERAVATDSSGGRQPLIRHSAM